MKSKRGQGLSLNTIIIAAIALIVLVVLVMIFTGRMGMFSRGVQEAPQCNQACIATGYSSGTNKATCVGDEEELVGYKDEAKNPCCCTK